jgi:transposase InsO family protein
MPWREVKPMDERVKFIARLLDGEKMTELCREFGISRKTGYKFLERYEKYGVGGLDNGSRRPHHLARKTADSIEELIVKLKGVYPTWGPKKLKAKIEKLHPGISFPAISTFGEILLRHGLVTPRKRRPLEERFHPLHLPESQACNEVWNTDFKGHFRLGNQDYCYPLTTSDDLSRYLLSCEALDSTKARPAMAIFEQLFDEYGLPETIKSDNGVPFSARGIGGLSELSAWWMSLGIKPYRIRPGNPQENGRHERMHRTLKAEATRPAGKNFLQQQEKFDDFRVRYNEERPHEALGMKAPSDMYEKSKRTLVEAQRADHYLFHDFTKRVSMCGAFRLTPTKQCFIGRSLRDLHLGFRELGQSVLLVSLGPFDIGYVDARKPIPQFTVDHPLEEEAEEMS